MSIYPSPCEKCERRERCESGGAYYKSCSRWLTWFRWWWKRFNAYAKKYGVEITKEECKRANNAESGEG